jgi:hypothetical protein
LTGLDSGPGELEEATAFGVFLVGLATALATGLGAVPFLVARRPTRSWAGVASARAGGFMLATGARLL